MAPWICQPHNRRIGSTIGPYKIREKIAEGGMGVVYVAEQTEPIRRKVALKIIKPGMASKEVLGPLRGRTSGSGDDGPSEYRPCARWRRHGDRVSPSS